MANLRARGQAPPAPLFDIDRIEILGITSGTDLDGDLVDDAATVYFRPLDRVGDVVKRGGEITIKLFDHAFPGGSRQVGYLHVSDSDQIRRCWYGKFWTNHYKVVVPFAPGADLRAGQEVDIYVRFLDLSTGRPFTARKVIKVDVVNPDETVEP